jgi:pyridoxal phosphate enzyme (YggS family)
VQPIDEPELTAELIRDRVASFMARLRAAAEAAGRDPDVVRLVAVTKGFGLAVVDAACHAGLSTLGENRVQEAIPKVEAHPDVDWHLIGRLQANKARQALRLFSTIHSVDSMELLQRLDRIGWEENLHRRVLLQVNVSGEERKAGFDVDWFTREASHPGQLSAALSALGAAEVTGLMTMAPFGADDREQRAVFGRLRDLRDRLEQRIGRGLPDLSMGMTADVEAAIAEGSTLVRIGTAIFGPRPHA